MITIVSLIEIVCILIQGKDNNTQTLHLILKFMEFSIAPMITVVCASTLLESRWTMHIMIALTLHTILEAISIFTGFIFYVDQNNVYHRGPYHFCYLITYSIGILFLFYQELQISKVYQNRKGGVLFCMLIFMISGTSIQLAEPTLRLDWLCVSMGSMMLYIYYIEVMQQIDGLTKLLNRHCYESKLEAIKQTAAIIIFDVDKFKSINDNYGHSYGDVCLKTVAAIIQEIYGEYGICYRIGGDEFCTIMEGNFEQLDDLNHRFLERIQLQITEQERFPQVSSGWVIFDSSKENLHSAIDRADNLMYQKKHQNRQEQS